MSEGRDNGPAREALVDVVRRVIGEFQALTGQQVDAVTGVRRGDDDGWSVLVDVVELERIPATTSVLATYRVDADSGGELRSYERLRRFSRGSVDQR